MNSNQSNFSSTTRSVPLISLRRLVIFPDSQCQISTRCFSFLVVTTIVYRVENVWEVSQIGFKHTKIGKMVQQVLVVLRLGLNPGRAIVHYNSGSFYAQLRCTRIGIQRVIRIIKEAIPSG